MPIPWSTIVKFAEMNSGLDIDTFSSIIRNLDDAYLNHSAGETKVFSREMLRG